MATSLNSPESRHSRSSERTESSTWLQLM